MWNVRPSQLIPLPTEDDGYLAYCLDDAVAWLGSTIEGELMNIHGKDVNATKAMRERVLMKLLSGKSKYADPLSSGKVIKSGS